MIALLSWFDETTPGDYAALERDPLLALLRDDDERVVYPLVQDDSDHWRCAAIAYPMTWHEWDKIPF